MGNVSGKAFRVLGQMKGKSGRLWNMIFMGIFVLTVHVFFFSFFSGLLE